MCLKHFGVEQLLSWVTLRYVTRKYDRKGEMNKLLFHEQLGPREVCRFGTILYVLASQQPFVRHNHGMSSWLHKEEYRLMI